MRCTKKIHSAVLILVLVAGCAIRDNTDLSNFHTQTGLLADETVNALEIAESFSHINMIEAIVDGEDELLEKLILKRESSFFMTTDSTSLSAELHRAGNAVSFTAASLSSYTTILWQLSEGNNLSLCVNSSTEPISGLFASVLIALVEQGRIEKNTGRMQQAMDEASPVIEELARAMADICVAAANSVQGCYADMSARRQRNIVNQGYLLESVEELSMLNSEVVELLAELEILHNGWLSVPLIHKELMLSLSDNSTSASLKILINRIDEIRKENE